jgi:hypothetical protein
MKYRIETTKNTVLSNWDCVVWRQGTCWLYQTTIHDKDLIKAVQKAVEYTGLTNFEMISI